LFTLNAERLSAFYVLFRSITSESLLHIKLRLSVRSLFKLRLCKLGNVPMHFFPCLFIAAFPPCTLFPTCTTSATFPEFGSSLQDSGEKILSTYLLHHFATSISVGSTFLSKFGFAGLPIQLRVGRTSIVPWDVRLPPSSSHTPLSTTPPPQKIRPPFACFHPQHPPFSPS
jgi:hypothetical protein